MKPLLIVDLEATCHEGKAPAGFFSEVIEIGALVLDPRTREVRAEFQRFVRPEFSPHLTPFCTELTTITQDQVDGGCPFAEALAALVAFGEAHGSAVFSSWGFYDRKQLEAECERKGVVYPFGDRHISLKHNHAKFLGLARPMGMAGALRNYGLELEGIHHRGIDDVRNIARIVSRMLDDGWTHRLLGGE
ncbi:MAG: 3'-5' exonuclease [Sumerlaeia bacterium]